MKPMATKEGEFGLLEYLEDIIGSNKYIEDIEKIDGEISMQNEERIEKINKVKAAQSELNGMEDEKNLAVKFVKMERNSMILQNAINFIDLSDTVEKINELTI
jgi:structural maintenance of chromosome 4|tara:strand:- start:328 stop:636 length:309 start_codon:yes stop_codon:yes gene_type:complete